MLTLEVLVNLAFSISLVIYFCHIVKNVLLKIQKFFFCLFLFFFIMLHTVLEKKQSVHLKYLYLFNLKTLLRTEHQTCGCPVHCRFIVKSDWHWLLS